MLRQIHAGGAVLPPHIASTVMESYASRGVDSKANLVWELTVREIEILDLIRQGLRNVNIAEHLAISSRTVESHVSSIISKLGARSRTDAVRVAEERGLIK